MRSKIIFLVNVHLYTDFMETLCKAGIDVLKKSDGLSLSYQMFYVLKFLFQWHPLMSHPEIFCDH